MVWSHVGFVAAAGGTAGMVSSVLPQAWGGLELQVHASFGFGVKSLLAGRLRCCRTLLYTPPTLEGSQWPAQHGASPGMPDLSPPSQTRPPLSQRQPLLGTPLHLESWLFTFLPSWHILCLQSRSQLHAEPFLPQLPVAAVVAADRFQIPVSSHGINASMTERQGDVAVLNVSLPASTFSLTS